MAWLQSDTSNPQRPVRNVESIRLDRGGHLPDCDTPRHRGTEKLFGIVLGAVTALVAATLGVAAQAPQGGAPGGRGAAAGQTVEKIRELKPNLYMVTGAGANTLVRVTP